MESKDVLDSRLLELRSNGARILECILYVKLNQQCSLTQATDIVVNSAAWIDCKEAFLQHQVEMFEEFLDSNRDRIEAIDQTITPEETTARVYFKPTGDGG